MSLTRLAFLLSTLIATCPWCFAGGMAQLPAGASIYSQAVVRLSSQRPQVRVQFYWVPGQSGFVQLASLDGDPIAEATVDCPNGFLDGTGAYDVTGEGGRQIVMYCQVGAGSTWAKVYELEGASLVEIGQWSGFSFKLLNLRGRPVVACQACHTTCFPNLYQWKSGSFRLVNREFPEFYEDEIAEDRDIIEGTGAYGASLFVQACAFGARALTYARRYDDALSLCEDALEAVAGTGRVVPESLYDTTNQAKAERLTAQASINKVLRQIDSARQTGAANLPGPAGAER